jgi:catechol 2,3-dioxygenase-like lactoylglutathione lyase family enzyme
MPTLPAKSILLGSTRAKELREWYLDVLAPDHTGDGPIVLGDLMLVIDQRDDIAAANPEPARSILNFHVDDFATYETQLDAAGVEWIARADDRPSGRFATFADPDGNYLQIIQFTRPPH